MANSDDGAITEVAPDLPEQGREEWKSLTGQRQAKFDEAVALLAMEIGVADVTSCDLARLDRLRSDVQDLIDIWEMAESDHMPDTSVTETPLQAALGEICRLDESIQTFIDAAIRR
jgi:hypothetical protein